MIKRKKDRDFIEELQNLVLEAYEGIFFQHSDRLFNSLLNRREGNFESFSNEVNRIAGWKLFLHK